jgi:type IV secretion system protein VirB2
VIFVIALQQASLSDPPPTSAITAAADWVSSLLFGPLTTIIAVLAIASVGLAMLSGRIELRRGASVVLGCFLLFGARGIVEGLQSTAMNDGAPSVANAPARPNFVRTPTQTSRANGYDPYAGAAVTRPSQ